MLKTIDQDPIDEIDLIPVETPTISTTVSYTEDNTTNSSCQPETLVNVSYQNNRFELEGFENICFIKNTSRLTVHDKKRNWKRNNITTFSKPSRNRLFQLLAKLKETYYTPPVHVTLTYHENYDLDTTKHSDDLHNFLIQIRYNYPNVGYIWRLELQKRGAPHFHIMFFLSTVNQTFSIRQFSVDCTKIWHRISDPNSEEHLKYGCKTTHISNYRHACSYLSKYIAKEEETYTGKLHGRRWGYSNNLSTEFQLKASMSQTQIVKFTRVIRNWLCHKLKRKSGFHTNLSSKYDYYVYIDITTLDKLYRFITKYERSYPVL